jgi:hypothetical protein
VCWIFNERVRAETRGSAGAPAGRRARIPVPPWLRQDGCYGAAAINSKRPYGDSYVTRNIAEILDAPDENWEYEDGDKAGLTDEAEERFMRLHVETMAALQVVLAAGEFRPGRYRRPTGWNLDWQRDDGAQ